MENFDIRSILIRNYLCKATRTATAFVLKFRWLREKDSIYSGYFLKFYFPLDKVFFWFRWNSNLKILFIKFSLNQVGILEPGMSNLNRIRSVFGVSLAISHERSKLLIGNYKYIWLTSSKEFQPDITDITKCARI
jgi:hypothetical protein